MSPALQELETLARQAGEILRSGFGQAHQVHYKSLIDLVTEMDRRSEAFLLSELRSRFPGDRIFAEESGGHAGRECCVWYVDPLDGTVNYAHGIPIYAVSIAYAQDGEIQLGVVYDPQQDECFSAARGQGAFLNGQPIHVSTPPDLDHSLLVTGFPYDIRTAQHNNLQEFTRFALKSQGVRRLGAAALDLAYIAAGRLDGYWELTLQPWDLAAGVLIAAEAGARVTTIGGQAEILTPPYSVLAASPHIHAQMLAVLNEQGQKP